MDNILDEIQESIIKKIYNKEGDYKVTLYMSYDYYIQLIDCFFGMNCNAIGDSKNYHKKDVKTIHLPGVKGTIDIKVSNNIPHFKIEVTDE